MWHEDFSKRYFDMLIENAISVAIEVVGHDHIADLRYHSSQNLPSGYDDAPEKFDFHNVFIAPGVTPEKGQNPGVAMFEISETGVPSNLRIEFIDMESFEGQSSLSYADLKFNSFDLAKDYGFSDLSADGLTVLRKYLQDD